MQLDRLNAVVRTNQRFYICKKEKVHVLTTKQVDLSGQSALMVGLSDEATSKHLLN